MGAIAMILMWLFLCALIHVWRWSLNSLVGQWIKCSHWQPLVYLPVTFLACSSFASPHPPHPPFLSSHLALVNHTQLLPSFILRCAPQGQGAVRCGDASCLNMPLCTVMPPVTLLMHISVSPPVRLQDCLFTFIFSCLFVPLFIIHVPVSLSFLFDGPLLAILEVPGSW